MIGADFERLIAPADEIQPLTAQRQSAGHTKLLYDGKCAGTTPEARERATDAQEQSCAHRTCA
jgi:hypothetical protein